MLIYSLVFPPDGVSTAQLLGELAVDLKSRGHDVYAVTTQPHYNRDAQAEAAQPLLRRRGSFLFESNFHGIRVIHTPVGPARRNASARARGWFAFHVLGLWSALRLMPRADVILVPSPLLTAGLVAWLITRLRGGVYVYNVQELYPALAVQMGRLRNPFLIRLLQGLERFVYTRSAAVTAISEDIRQGVLESGVVASKVHFIPNFVDLSDLKPLPRENDFARQHDLLGRFVISYAGNIGFAQGLQILDVAAAAREFGAVRVLLVGDGVLDEKVRAAMAEGQLSNVIRLSHQPYAMMPQLYASSDVCLVPLLGLIQGSALPSKMFRIMACARPVLVICDPTSELARLVTAARAGVVVPPARPDLLRSAIKTLVANEEMRREMGSAGRRFVEQNYSRPRVTAAYSRLLDSVGNR